MRSQINELQDYNILINSDIKEVVMTSAAYIGLFNSDSALAYDHFVYLQ